MGHRKMDAEKAGREVLKVIRAVKPFATGKVFKALHTAEGLLAGALRIVDYSKKKTPERKKPQKASKGDK